MIRSHLIPHLICSHATVRAVYGLTGYVIYYRCDIDLAIQALYNVMLYAEAICQTKRCTMSLCQS